MNEQNQNQTEELDMLNLLETRCNLLLLALEEYKTKPKDLPDNTDFTGALIYSMANTFNCLLDIKTDMEKHI